MAETLILTGIAVGLVAVLMFALSRGMTGSSGGSSTTAMMGATFELLSKDQQKAAEEVVQEQSGARREDDETGDGSHPDTPKEHIHE